jgi:hypothetical protein
VSTEPILGDYLYETVGVYDQAVEIVRRAFGGDVAADTVIPDATLHREDLVREEVERLLDLWRVWDNNPRSNQLARLLEAQVSKVAGMFHTTGSRLREWVISNRAELGLSRSVIDLETPAQRRQHQIETHLAEFRAWRETWRCLWCKGPLEKRAMYCSDTCSDASVTEEAHKRRGQKAHEPQCNQTLLDLDDLSTP